MVGKELTPKDAIFLCLALQPVVTSYFALPPQNRCWLRRGAGAFTGG